MVYNIACMPKEEKYRSLKLTNEKIKRLIVDTPGAMEAMTELGWEESDGVLQCTKNLTMAQVRSACLLQSPGRNCTSWLVRTCLQSLCISSAAVVLLSHLFVTGLAAPSRIEACARNTNLSASLPPGHGINRHRQEVGALTPPLTGITMASR